eukprot:COSAG01_NODE_3863_length_5621_cov_2.450970_1_plen_83_part_00
MHRLLGFYLRAVLTVYGYQLWSHSQYRDVTAERVLHRRALRCQHCNTLYGCWTEVLYVCTGELLAKPMRLAPLPYAAHDVNT